MESLGMWGPILLMVVIFYFLLIRPQKKAQKRRKELLDNLKVGQRVMTIGGIYGKVTAIKDKVVTLEIAEHVNIEISRAAVNMNLTKKKEDAEEASEDAEKQ
jgi:preprotein translocase subunit YajC